MHANGKLNMCCTSHSCENASPHRHTYIHNVHPLTRTSRCSNTCAVVKAGRENAFIRVDFTAAACEDIMFKGTTSHKCSESATAEL